jgi:hypothetical protein
LRKWKFLGGSSIIKREKERRTSIVVYLLWSNKHTQSTQKENLRWGNNITDRVGCVWGKFSREEKQQKEISFPQKNTHSSCHFQSITFTIKLRIEELVLKIYSLTFGMAIPMPVFLVSFSLSDLIVEYQVVNRRSRVRIPCKTVLISVRNID